MRTLPHLRNGARRFLAIVFALILACSPRDPIDNLVKKLSSDPYWYNGYEYPLRLPPNVSQVDLVLEALKHSDLPQPTPASIHIASHRDVIIHNITYSAFLLETDVGRRIVLLQYVALLHGWRHFVFEA